MSASFSDPRENVLQLGVRPGMRIGDFGAGSGHYTRAAAAALSGDGLVIAVDIQEDVLTHLARNTHEAHLHSIKTQWGDIEKVGGTHIPSGSLDAVILANTLFQVKDRDGLMAELKRVLRPGGKLLIVDWAGSYGGMGPAPDHVVSEHAAEDLFIAAGFHKEKSFRAGPHHYGIVCSAP